MDIISLQNEVATRLLSKRSMQGNAVVSLDRLDILNEVERSIANLGNAIIVGTTQGGNLQPNALSAVIGATVGVRIIENVVINRGRPLVATVATQAARIALAGTVQVGQAVDQVNVSVGTYALVFQGDSTSAINIATDPTATQIQNALNAMSAIADGGGVTVTASGLTFLITFNSFGAQQLIAAKPMLNLPLGITFTLVRSVIGGVATKEVQQLTIAQRFWLASDAGSADFDWAYQLTATQTLQLVIRSLHMWPPTGYQVLLFDSYDYGTDDTVVDIVAKFKTRLILENADVA
jgi:hypothetical protein